MVIPVFFNLLSLFYLTLSTTSFSALSSKLLQNIEDAAKRSYLDPKLVQAVIAVESNFDSKATSHKGAMGLMQVMPKTADVCDVHEPHHAVNNLMGACECLRRLINRYRGNLSLALAAYNAGPTNVDRHKGIPPFPETKAYVKKILSKYSELKRNPNR
ncbi:MAG: lytic transglycosylase domain-containing protein [Deltaproteobacteria bacterium]|nr:lytic transglycosylase domain-containing protein [Deltaproteobacteria bacterium]